MICFKSITCFILLCCLAITPLLSSATPYTVREDITPSLSVTCHIGLGEYVQRGDVIPLTMVFDNAGGARKVVIETGPGLKIEKTIRLPAQESAKRVIYIPLFGRLYATYGQLRNLYVSGAESGNINTKISLTGFQSELKSQRRASSGSRSRGHRRSKSPFGSSSDGKIVSAVSVSGSRSFAINKSLDKNNPLDTVEVDPRLLPDSWRGYTSVDVLIVDATEWRRSKFPQKAVCNWIATGGTCLLVENATVSNERIVKDLRKQVPFLTEYKEKVYHGGSGGLIFLTKTSLTNTHENFFQSNGLTAFRRRPEEASTDWEDVLPIKGLDQVPFLPFLVFLTVFAILVGPVGWWYMVKQKQKGLSYYIIAPSVSLLFVILVITVDLFQEGIKPRVHCRLADFIDQRVQTALREGAFGVYAPFASGTTLRIPATDTPHWFGSNRNERRPNRISCSITFEENHSVLKGVIPTRDPAWLGITSARNERRRLLVSRQKGNLIVENHLGYSLKDLTIRFQDKYFLAKELPSGASKKATPLTRDRVFDKTKTLLGQRVDSTNRLRHLKQRFRNHFLDKQVSAEQPLFRYLGKRTGSFREALWIKGFHRSTMRGIVAGVGTPGSADDKNETEGN